MERKARGWGEGTRLEKGRGGEEGVRMSERGEKKKNHISFTKFGFKKS